MQTEIKQEAPWRAGLKSARAIFLPGLVLQVTALLLVLAYYQHAPTRAAVDHMVAWRHELGVAFGMVSTAIFGGLLPVLYYKARASTRDHYTWAQAFVLTVFWGYKGFEVDYFYRMLARLFGEGHDVATIAQKAFVDEFIYCPFFAVPVSVVVYEWVQSRFDTAGVAADFRAARWIKRRVIPVLISNLGVWLPTVCIIYSLPTGLQLPLQNLVLCFFTLLIAHQTRRTV